MITQNPSFAGRRLVSVFLTFLLISYAVATAAEPENEPVAPEKTTEVSKEDSNPAKDRDSTEEVPTEDLDDEVAVEDAEASAPAVARPVNPDPVQVYGWRENVEITGISEILQAKLDTGAHTSSIHAEQKELFERDGKKWVRFTVTDPRVKDSPRTQIEAPLVRIARIKEPGGESTPREVVKLTFKIGDRKLRADFTLNNRKNMLSPVLIGRITIKELGWIDPSRTNLADKKVMR